jgi:tetratricopeptide (TPR) repeat protein
VRFGKWDEILALPAPADYLLVKTAMWHFARGCALAAKGRVAEAEAEAAAFEKAVAAVPQERYMAINPAHNVLAIGTLVLAGEIAYRKGDLDTAIGKLKEATKLEDALVYMEPPEWTIPVRHALGAILLQKGDVAAAEAVYREDLAQWPDNGWSLYGLSECIERRGGAPEELALAESNYRKAWADADIDIAASCLCVKGPTAR